jgi:hypothetical protein
MTSADPAAPWISDTPLASGLGPRRDRHACRPTDSPYCAIRRASLVWRRRRPDASAAHPTSGEE